MSKLFRGRAVVAALAVTLFAWGCDGPATPPTAPPLSPTVEADPLLRGILKTVTPTLKFVTTKAHRLTDQVVQALVTQHGGTLSLLGHALDVPAGAVAHPTFFTMTVLAGSRVEVELSAVEAGLGTDVGARGFDIPVRLALSYADTEVSDPDRLVIVRIEADGTKTPIPSTVDKATRTVAADLDRFSRYGLCEN